MSKKAFAFGLLVVILLVIGLYRAKDGARESSDEILRLEAEIAEAYRQRALLEADLAHMSREEWLEEYARKELGMAPARANQYATEYNLDLLIGAAETVSAPASDVLATARPEGEAPDLNNSVSVPVPDALNSKPEEDAEQE